MLAGLVRVVVVLTLLALPAAPSSALGREECAAVTTGSGSGTNATASTEDGYSVHARALGQTVDAEALESSCVGDTTAKSSELVFDTLGLIFDQAPPLP